MAARHFKVQISIITNLQFFGKYLEQSISKMVGDTQRAVGSAYSVLRYIAQIRRHKWGYYVSLPEIGDYIIRKYLITKKSKIVLSRSNSPEIAVWEIFHKLGITKISENPV